MAWDEVRAAVDGAAETFERVADVLAKRADEAAEVNARVSELFEGSSSSHAREAREHTSVGTTGLSGVAERYRHAAERCRAYLAWADPGGHGGSVRGLESPTAFGELQGGKGPRGCPPARRAITDVTEPRMRVFVEQGPTGMADLIERDDGIIAERLRYLDAGGHGPGRHGGKVTDERLRHRVQFGRDPMTGTKRDWHTGREHRSQRYATAFTSDTAYVFAEASVSHSRRAREERTAADAAGLLHIQVSLPASEVFGEGFQAHLRGFARVEGVARRAEPAPILFDGTTVIVANYIRSAPGRPWVPVSCFPKRSGE